MRKKLHIEKLNKNKKEQTVKSLRKHKSLKRGKTKVKEENKMWKYHTSQKTDSIGNKIKNETGVM